MKRILLIDRNEIESEQISRLFNLQLGNLTTQQLRTEEEVEQYFASNSQGNISQMKLPELIILDIDFPNASNGLYILEKIYNNIKMKDIPVLIFTNNTDKATVANCYVRGANGYFLKPTETSNFQKSVQMLADRWQNIVQRGFGYNYKAV